MKYLFFLLLLSSISVFSFDIIVYENPSVPKGSSTLKKLKGSHQMTFKAYHANCNLPCMLSESLFYSYLYLYDSTTNNTKLTVYKTQTGNKIFSFKAPLSPNSYIKLMQKANTLLELKHSKAIDIFQAIDQDEKRLIKYFAKSQLHTVNGMGMTPLNYALSLKKYELLPLLLKSSKQVLQADYKGITPLHRLAEMGNLKLFKAFYSPYLNHLKTASGNTLLHYALKSGQVQFIHFLIRNGLSLKDENNYKKNALAFASESGNIELFDFVLKQHPEFLIKKTQYHQNILHFASQSGNFACVEHVIEKLKEKNFDYQKHAFDSFHRNYIFYSVLANKENYIQNFLKLKENFQTDNAKNTALHFAVQHGKNISVRELIGLKLDPKKENIHKETPLLLAFKHLNLKDTLPLITDLSYQDLKNKSGMSPLHYAVLGNKFETIKYLLDHHVDLNIKSDFGENSLFFSIITRSEPLFMYLFYRGVDHQAKLKNGDTLLHMAAQEQNPWFYRFLINHGTYIYLPNKQESYPLDSAILFDNLSIIKTIYEKTPFEFYRADIENNKAFHKVIAKGNKAVFDYFIEKKIRTDLPNNTGDCVLDLAIKMKRKYFIDTLEKLGAMKCNN